MFKEETGYKETTWNVLFSFYVHHDVSYELRAIRLVIEKTNKKEAVDLYVSIRETVAAHMSVDLSTTCLDQVYIRPNDLAQLMLVVYDKEAIKKTRLLDKVKARCDSKGICAGEVVAILLTDFLKLEENNSINYQGTKTLSEVSKFMKAATKSDTINKLGLTNISAEKKTEDENEQQFTQTEDKTKKTRAASAIKIKAEDRIEKIVKRQEIKRSKTPIFYEKQKEQVFLASKETKIDQVNYIVQQKNKAEDNLIKAASLIKKSNKDYNELLQFSTSMKHAFADIYNKLVIAQNQETGSKAAGKPPLPVKQKVVESYDTILTYKVRSIQNELAPILEYFIDDKIAMKSLKIDGRGNLVDSHAGVSDTVDKKLTVLN